ncbi:nuclear transport factor 2 family protein [Salegentibacter salegens]|uniref:Ketosteroid isomerase-related protein n=1 Tax=Salegentibacter salegens TaxID=143223 RepID=A0A1M7J637_9FLAO|nr:nuclear transport factor 2 family protein [Salegentibacter salegens]PRX47349.1 ketosteroid isomerase-like protein [Salegentibacter salegens]SHM48343.1 Ketosteroid isomerase-related protein [Salegentibacter salegens]
MTEKEKFIQELNEAFAKGDVPFVLDCMADDIVWEMIGGKTSNGKEEIEKEMAAMKDIEMLEMTMDKVITHGKTAAANGHFRMKHNGEEKAYGFCDLYEFNGFKKAKIKKMTSYVILLKKK